MARLFVTWICLLIVLLPLLGALIYLIVRGGSMAERSMKAAADQVRATREYIASMAESGSTAEELEKLSKLRTVGTLTEAEFQAQKAKLLTH
ncbi:MAG: SHOCT domain-containing protein [Sporichthyaceae bacterium]|nr:SHOCT domain-containing protein [Sporichthyaceae bacterium]